VFSLDASPETDYRSVIDEECKVRARTPSVSKFQHVEFDFSDEERLERYVAHVTSQERSRANNIASFFRATFEAWHNHTRSGNESLYVGYSPIVVVDTEKIIADFPNGHVLHVVRNPWSAYADTKKRPVPLDLNDYMLGWTLNQYYALAFRKRYPGLVHILRIEDVMDDPAGTLGRLCKDLGLDPSATLSVPSWNGRELIEVYPWGTIRRPTPEENRQVALELSNDEREAIRLLAGPYLESFRYSDFL
jgi:hypothetical protein